MSWYDAEGQSIYYEDRGRGDAVMVLPGWGGSFTELDRLRRELLAGFRTIAVDLPGSGRSQPQPRDYSSSYYFDDAHTLLRLLDELDVHVAHLVGFSDGGEEALLMATLDPGRALSLVTWGAAGQVVAEPAMLAALARLVEGPIEALAPLAAFLVEAYGVDNARRMSQSWAGALRTIVNSGGDLARSGAARITCPALLITGADDPFCPPSLVGEMAEAIPGGSFIQVDGAGHDVHQSHPDWLYRTVVDWLGQH